MAGAYNEYDLWSFDPAIAEAVPSSVVGQGTRYNRVQQ